MELRIRCHLLGCEAEQSAVYTCDHCGTYYMDDAWIGTTSLQYLVWKIKRLAKRGRNFPFAKCEQCGKRFLAWRGYADDFCSDECYSNWLPF